MDGATRSGSVDGSAEEAPRGQRWAPGDRVAGRYRVVRFIADGGMGSVYEVEDEELGQRVALKTIRGERAGDEHAVARFRREVQLARRVAHPNVCRVYDLGAHTGEEGGPVRFLTMELLDGETLRDRVRRKGRLGLDEAHRWLVQLAAGLQAAHAAGVIHRDFKSGNVILVGERAVIADFGLASAGAIDGARLTETGARLGTPSYMAPEQAAGAPVTPATDVYALGVVLYQMVTGELPFPGGAERTAPRPPRELVPDLPDEWERAIVRCLAADPGERFERPEEVARSLGERLSEAREALLPGTRVGEYVVRGQIGAGGMGVVYLAEHPVIGKQAAIKVMRPSLEARASAVARFVQEARAVNQIGHPHIVDVFSFGELADGRPYFVMELLRGESLAARLERARPSLAESVEILLPICRALEAAHARGVVHRDLKPDNVFLAEVEGEPPRVKLLDFGVAKLVDEGAWRVEHTKTGAILGTPAYVAPEQARGQAVERSADVYALGCMIYEMVLGRLPFVGPSAMDVIAMHLSAAPPRPRTIARDVPRALDRLLPAMLAKEAAARPGLPEVRAALAALVGGASTAAPVPKRRAGWVIGGLVVAGLLAAALISWSAWSQRAPAPLPAAHAPSSAAAAPSSAAAAPLPAAPAPVPAAAAPLPAAPAPIPPAAPLPAAPAPIPPAAPLPVAPAPVPPGAAPVRGVPANVPPAPATPAPIAPVAAPAPGRPPRTKRSPNRVAPADPSPASVPRARPSGDPEDGTLDPFPRGH